MRGREQALRKGNGERPDHLPTCGPMLWECPAGPCHQLRPPAINWVPSTMRVPPTRSASPRGPPDLSFQPSSLSSPRHATASLLLTALAVVAAPGPLQAQAPKVSGEAYEEVARYGFSFQPPRDWEFVPPAPGTPHLIGMWTPESGKRSVSAGEGQFLYPRCLMLAFDRRRTPALLEESGGTEEERTREWLRRGALLPDLSTWMEELGDDYLGSGFELVSDEELPLEKLPGARRLLYLGTSHALLNEPGSAPCHALVGVYPLGEDLEVALVFTAPAREPRWTRWRKSLEQMMLSFERGRVLASPDALAELPLRERRRLMLKAEVMSQPGWELFTTPDYFLVSSSEDEDFVEEIIARLGELRSTFRRDFPEEAAREALEARARERGKEPEEDPLIASRCSVVRVCKDRDQYFTYGGPLGSAGYWFALQEELVLYDDQDRQGRDATWRVLGHEAFHQYIHYYMGNQEPHSWFNEGHAEYYAGFERGRQGQLRRAPLRLARQSIQGQLREGRIAPLDKLLRWSRTEFYGDNSLGRTLLENYSQAWSLVWFLRTQEGERRWNSAWSRMLDAYTATLLRTGSTIKALEAATADIDLAELERAWLDFAKNS